MVQAAFGGSVARQFQVGPAATPLTGQINPNNFINDGSDFDFDELTNLGVSSLGELTRQLKTMLPASGNVVTDNGEGPVLNTKFGIHFL